MGILKFTYPVFIGIFISTLVFFGFIGINILSLRAAGKPLWITSTNFVTYIISFTGLSMSIIAIMISFRRDHLLVLHHTDKLRRYIIYLVIMNLFLLFINYSFVVSDWVWDEITCLNRVTLLEIGYSLECILLIYLLYYALVITMLLICLYLLFKGYNCILGRRE